MKKKVTKSQCKKEEPKINKKGHAYKKNKITCKNESRYTNNNKCKWTRDRKANLQFYALFTKKTHPKCKDTEKVKAIRPTQT